MGYLLIGDIHSQGVPLAKALKCAKQNGLVPLFLGDLFDSRCDRSDTLYVYNLIRCAEKELGAIVLNSNHQIRLRQGLCGGPLSPSVASETLRSLEEFEESGVDLEELKEWLSNKPDGFSFRSADNTLYCCSHAYFPAKWVDQKAKGPQFFSANSETEEDFVCWGPLNSKGQRVRWWEDDSQRSWTRCAGHYHTVHIGQSNIVLDGNSGYPDGKLPVYHVDDKSLVYFS